MRKVKLQLSVNLIIIMSVQNEVAFIKFRCEMNKVRNFTFIAFKYTYFSAEIRSTNLACLFLTKNVSIAVDCFTCLICGVDN